MFHHQLGKVRNRSMEGLSKTRKDPVLSRVKHYIQNGWPETKHLDESFAPFIQKNVWEARATMYCDHCFSLTSLLQRPIRIVNRRLRITMNLHVNLPKLFRDTGFTIVSKIIKRSRNSLLTCKNSVKVASSKSKTTRCLTLFTEYCS